MELCCRRGIGEDENPFLPALSGAALALLLPAREGHRRGLPDIEARIEALLARMTLEEKVGQLNLVSAGPAFDPEQVRRGGVGA